MSENTIQLAGNDLNGLHITEHRLLMTKKADRHGDPDTTISVLLNADGKADVAARILARVKGKDVTPETARAVYVEVARIIKEMKAHHDEIAGLIQDLV